MTDWLVLTVLICVCIYLTVMVFYFKTLLKKERLTDELNKVKNDANALRTRNSQYRLENDKLRQRIRELEGKIEALL